MAKKTTAQKAPRKPAVDPSAARPKPAPVAATFRYDQNAAAAVTGVPRSTMRSWRTRYHFPSPPAEAGDSRSKALTMADLAALKAFAIMLDKGVSSGVAKTASLALRDLADTALREGRPLPEVMVIGFGRDIKGAKVEPEIQFTSAKDLPKVITASTARHGLAAMLDIRTITVAIQRGFEVWSPKFVR